MNSLRARLQKLPFTPLQLAIHVYVWQGLVVLLVEYLTHHLTANPLQAIQQRTGREALFLLILSLACTPVSTITGWREPLKRSRTLGLYAFLVAVVHVLIFLDLDNGIAWDFFVQTIIEKPYIIFGATTFVLLIPLAMTSFDIWKARLGKRWKLLHQLVYLIVPIGILHYALSKKGDIFHLTGDIVRPLEYALVVAVLLALRLAFMRKFFASLRGRLVLLFAKPSPQPHA